MTEDRQPGRRERKKQRTRELIAETALRLFLERGFERVTVAEVARAADVAEQTVFNYFPTKEDLVYWRLAGFADDLLAAIRQRTKGESLVAAFRRFVLERQGLLGDDDPTAFERLARINRMIFDSPALLARERGLFDHATTALAALIAEENNAAPRDLEAWVVANSLVGVHRALVGYVRQAVLSGERGPRLRRQVHACANRAFRILDRGLDRYGAR